MEEISEEHGLLPVMLASSLSKCKVAYKSQTKTFHLFNKYAISIDIIDGLGVLDPETFLTPSYNSDETEYEEIFEIDNDEFIGDLDPQIQSDVFEVYNHLKKLVGVLYSSYVTDLEISFGLLDGELYLTDVLKCKIVHTAIVLLKVVLFNQTFHPVQLFLIWRIFQPNVYKRR